MSKKFEVYKNELVDILIKRAHRLSDTDWYLPLESERAVENVQIALDEYKRRMKEFQEENPIVKSK